MTPRLIPGRKFGGNPRVAHQSKLRVESPDLRIELPPDSPQRTVLHLVNEAAHLGIEPIRRLDVAQVTDPRNYHQLRRRNLRVEIGTDS